MLQSIATSSSTPITQEDNIVEKTLLSIQEKVMDYYDTHATIFSIVESLSVFPFQFELLEQLGFEGYSVLVNTSALQTHLIATSKGKTYHKCRQQMSKPLENPFIGHVFSDNPGKARFIYCTCKVHLMLYL